MFFKLLWKSGPFVETNDTEEAFQELKRYLTSPPVMVASEPDEPLLLYIAATLEAMSMVLVAKWFDPHAPHELESSSADGSGSQDPQPMEEPRADAAAGSQSPEATMAPLARMSRGPQVQSPCQAQRVGSSLGLHPWKWMRRTPPPPPPGGLGPSNVRCKSSANSSTKPGQCTWRSTSCFMQSSLPLGSYTTTSSLTGSQW
jgi:dsDNA-binding SOS-regulon protein